MIRFMVPLLAALMAGCGGLQETWSGPGHETFHPKTIAVLPPIVGAYEGARESAQEAMVAALAQSGRFERVLTPDEVSGAFQAKPATVEWLFSYLGKLETVGTSDPEIAAKLGDLLQAEAILVLKVNAWEYARAEGDKFGRVAFGARLVDAKKGTIVWKARHEERSTYMIFKPKLADLATELSKYMVKYMDAK